MHLSASEYHIEWSIQVFHYFAPVASKRGIITPFVIMNCMECHLIWLHSGKAE